MQTVWKYPVPIQAEFAVDMPEGAEVLTVQGQGFQYQMWARVDADAVLEERRFHIRGTGHPLTGNEGRYVGTFQQAGGLLVWHLFEASS